jgi:hypothetical protein
MEDFEHLSGWDLLIESKQYRSNTTNINLRNVSDFAFLDLLSLYILQNEYETAAISKNYADKTIGYRNFLRPRLSGTDLYTSLNILANPDSVFSKKIHQNPEADAILRGKLRVHTPTIKRYLDLLADGSLRSEDASVLLLRIEKQLNITDSKLKSIRRLAQDWSGINDMQRELVVARMLQYYHRFAKRSELGTFLEDMGKSKGYKLNAPVDADLANLGYGAKIEPEKHIEPGKKGWLATLAPAAGLIAGYKLGYALTGPKNKH